MAKSFHFFSNWASTSSHFSGGGRGPVSLSINMYLSNSRSFIHCLLILPITSPFATSLYFFLHHRRQYPKVLISIVISALSGYHDSRKTHGQGQTAKRPTPGSSIPSFRSVLLHVHAHTHTRYTHKRMHHIFIPSLLRSRIPIHSPCSQLPSIPARPWTPKDPNETHPESISHSKKKAKYTMQRHAIMKEIMHISSS